ncbi:hypothetical protein [Selenomonas sp. AE3005]|uniref:hypothetical protein n=1 Tax=Selenomonas sp. AE3005 TaxID=1485543 RepID=UPI00048472D6|nr:hypothetical protein [Selenomonas sp. AE3005]
MDKLMMNKLDDMELDMVAGGYVKNGGPDDNNSPAHRLGRKMNNAIVNGGKAVVNGVKAVGSAFGRFFRLARECRDRAL